MGDVKLLHPWALLSLLLLVPFLVLRLRGVARAAVPFAPLQYHRPGLARRAAPRLPPLLEALAAGAMALVLAGPYREHSFEKVRDKGIDVALVLDVSASMMAADFRPTRLEALKKIASDFVRRSGGNRVGVVLFAGDTFTQSPLTTDHAVLLELIGAVSFGMIDHGKSGGTAIGDALLSTADSLAGQRVEGRDQAVILVTDGESNLGADPLLAARFCKERGVRLSVVGVGGDAPVEVLIDGKPFITNEDKPLVTSLDDRQLKAIAAAAGGSYQRARSGDVLAAIFDDLGRLSRTPLEVETARVRTPLGRWAALASFLFFLLWLVVSGVVRRPMR